MSRKKVKPKPPAQRRARGTGIIRPNTRRGGWMARVQVGHYPNGRPKYKEVSDPTHEGVVKKMKLVQAPDPHTVTVAEWGERWLSASRASEPTKGDYRHTLDQFVIPQLGRTPLLKLTAHDIEQASRVWAERLGPNTLRKNLAQLATMLEAARRARLVTENVAELAPKPKKKKVPIRPFTLDETARIIEAATGPRVGIFALLAAVGCRLGEAIALDVGDFDGARVSITKTYCPKYGTRRPKSENGVRTVKVPAQAIPALVAAKGGRTKGPLFPTELGTRERQNTIRHRWGTFLKGLGIPYRNPHQLRHSVATHAIAAGTPIANVARDLGDTVNTIVNTYLHATDGAEVGDVMEGLLRGRSVAGDGAPEVKGATAA